MSLGYNPVGRCLSNILATTGEVSIHITRKEGIVFATAKTGRFMGASTSRQGLTEDFTIVSQALKDLESKMASNAFEAFDKESDYIDDESLAEDSLSSVCSESPSTIDLEDAIAEASAQKYDAVQHSLDKLKKNSAIPSSSNSHAPSNEKIEMIKQNLLRSV